MVSALAGAQAECVATPQDPAAVKLGRDFKGKAILEDAPVKEEWAKLSAHHKTHKGTGGSQAHSFVRHLIENAASR